MKAQDKAAVSCILDQCLEMFLSWKKKSSSITDILNQLDGLRRSNWETFELPLTVKRNLDEELEMRLMDELQSLSNEIDNLKSHEETLASKAEALQTYCSSQLVNVINPGAFDGLRILFDIISSLRLIIGIKQVSLRRISIEEMDNTFVALTEVNEALKPILKEFTGFIDHWKSQVSKNDF